MKLAFIILLSLVFQTSFCQTSDSAVADILIAVIPAIKNKPGHYKPENEKYPVILTLPDGKNVWMGGLHDMSRFTMRIDMMDDFPLFKLEIQDSLKVRFRFCDLYRIKNGISNWEQHVVFDTTIVFYKQLSPKRIILIRKIWFHYNYPLSGQKNNELVVTEVPTANKQVLKISFEEITNTSDKLFWLYKKKPNGMWDAEQSKTIIRSDFVPQQLQTDERFIMK